MPEPSALEVVRRLTARKTSGETPSDALLGAQAACQSLHHELALWLGVDGSRALFASAMGRVRAAHPALGDIRHEALLSPNHPAIVKGVQNHGAAATATALQATLVVLIELLGRLIGDDMAARIVERSEKGSQDNGPS